MPYLLLALGAGIGLYALYRFFLKATPHQIKSFFLTSVSLVLLLALFFMAVTGRLGPALALFVALLPLVRGVWQMRKKSKEDRQTPSSSGTSVMDKREALDILGLENGADKSEILRAYKDLMKKVHPDTKGSQGLARKLNEAKDVLLKNKADDTDRSDQS